MSEDLKSVFIPSLSAILINAEDKKGKPLTKEEVIEFRDNAAVIMMEPEDADKMAESRGYDDLDPENCWYDFQMLRRSLDRKPDLDPGVKFTYTSSNDEGMQQAIQKAKDTLDDFRRLFEQYGTVEAPMVKYTIEQDGNRAHMWMIVTEDLGDGFTAELFEVPEGFTNYKPYDSFNIKDFEIQDWMLNLNGTLHGGWTLRYQRESMTQREREQFDEHIGISDFAE